jgi:hypothetical protein
MSDLGDEPSADVISGGGEGFGTFVASRWPGLMRLTRRLVASFRLRPARIIGVMVLAAAAAIAAPLLIPDTHPAITPGPPAQQAVITNPTAGPAGFVGRDGWMGAVGCRRGRSCPAG